MILLQMESSTLSDDTVKHYRKLAGGGEICLVRHGEGRVWKYRSGPNVLRGGSATLSWPEEDFSTIEEFAVKVCRIIDYEDYVLHVLPTPRRREAIEATRNKL